MAHVGLSPGTLFRMSAGWPLAAVLLLSVVGCDEQSPSLTDPELEPVALVASASAPLALSQLTVGGQHTCGLSNSRAYCWGDNVGGQIGDGRSAFRTSRPTRVSGGLQFAQLSAGRAHTCGITIDDRAYCWGENLNGQVGDGTTTGRAVPVPVAGGRRFRQIRAGSDHTCAVTPSNVGFCWGRGGFLGDGTAIDRLTPVQVLGGHSWRRVVAGGVHSCGVTSHGRG
jgi:alpha-tubulin suppressor-like RCC1 family protein